jgi:hypothetical protein
MSTLPRHSVWMAVAILVLGFTPVPAQTPSRLATTLAALRASPVFFHGKQVAALGSVIEQRGFYRLEAEAPAPGAEPSMGGGRNVFVYWREQPPRTTGEIRGEFWDLGRLTESDPRFSSYDFKPMLEAVADGRWPGRDQTLVILNATMVEGILPDTPTLRSIVLSPDKYENRSARISGRFRGRNLHADVAGPVPTPTKWDFVLQSADAALWISGLRPRGKGFELDPSARVDTGRWVEVAGTVRRDGSRVWLEAREIELSAAPDETTTVEIAAPATPAEPPPTVVFSAPVPDEVDVDTGVVVRIQFSRDMDARSFKDRLRVSYVAPASPGQTAAQTPPPIFAFAYNVGSRGIELKFAKPLERFQTVRVEILDGVKAIDGQPLPPWALTFSTSR